MTLSIFFFFLILKRKFTFSYKQNNLLMKNRKGGQNRFQRREQNKLTKTSILEYSN